jgi:monovalent cation:H+ antiporter-2, CPA2 family
LCAEAVRREVLLHAGLQRAAILVIAISDQLATRHAVALARELRPDLYIIVRTRYLSEVPELYELGATQVIPEEFETSIEIFVRVLERYGIAPDLIQREAEDVRKAGYELLRSAPSSLSLQ